MLCCPIRAEGPIHALTVPTSRLGQAAGSSLSRSLTLPTTSQDQLDERLRSRKSLSM